MATGPGRGEFGVFAAGGESSGVGLNSANIRWRDGVAPSTWSVSIEAGAKDIVPAIGSTQIAHFLTGGQDQALLTFEQLFVENSHEQTGVRAFSEMQLQGTCLRGKWRDAGTITLHANHAIPGAGGPEPAAQNAGSRNPNGAYPTQFWRSVNTILRHLFMRLNFSVDDLIVDGTRGMLDMAQLSVTARAIGAASGAVTPILDDAPEIHWEDVPLASALQDILSQYGLTIRLTPDAKIGFRLTEQTASDLPVVRSGVIALAGEVQTIGEDTNVDPLPDSIVYVSDEVVIEDYLACELVIEDPSKAGNYISCDTGESLAAVGVLIDGAGFTGTVPPGRPSIGDTGPTITRLWQELAHQNPPFAEIADDRLRKHALQFGLLGRVAIPRVVVPRSSPDAGDIVTISDHSEGTTITQEFRVPRLTGPLLDNSTSGTFDPGAGGQPSYDPVTEAEAIEPWRIFPLLDFIASDGSPHRVVVKNAVVKSTSTANMGSASSVYRDFGPIIGSPQGDESHEDAEEWPELPTIVDAYQGVIHFGKPIFGHSGQTQGDRSLLCDRLSWAVNKGITADVREVADQWGRPYIWWRGSYALRCNNNELLDRTTSRSFAIRAQQWSEQPRPEITTLAQIDEVPVSGENPAKAWTNVKVIRRPGIQLRLRTLRTDTQGGGVGSPGGGTTSFEPDSEWGDLEGTFTYHDTGGAATAGNPGAVEPISPEHAAEVNRQLQALHDGRKARIDEFRAAGEPLGGLEAVIDGWRPEAAPGTATSWPVDVAVFSVVGRGPSSTKITVNARGPRSEGDPAEDAAIIGEEAARKPTLPPPASLAEQATVTGGAAGTSGGGGGSVARASSDSLLDNAVAGMQTPTLPLACGMVGTFRDEVGGRLDEHLGEIAFVELPRGRMIWKGQRHSHDARAWIPGDHTELLLDRVRTTEMDSGERFAMLEGLQPMVSGARDKYHGSLESSPGTNLKIQSDYPIRNVFFIDKPGEGEGEERETIERHADIAIKLYRFFDRKPLEAGDALGQGGQLRKRSEDVDDLASAAVGRGTITFDDTEPFEYEQTPATPEPEPGEPEPEPEEPEDLPVAVDAGMNWAWALLVDQEDLSGKAIGNRYYEQGEGVRSLLGGSLLDADKEFKVENVEDWHNITRPGTTSPADCSYCGISDFGGETIGFSEDIDPYSLQSQIAALAWHVDAIWSAMPDQTAAIMAWAYANKAMISLVELECCLCDATDFASFQACVCDGETPLVNLHCDAICDEDCLGDAQTKPDCCP